MQTFESSDGTALVGAANNALTPAHLFATEFDGQALHKNRNGPAPDDDHVMSLLAVGEPGPGGVLHPTVVLV